MSFEGHCRRYFVPGVEVKYRIGNDRQMTPRGDYCAYMLKTVCIYVNIVLFTHKQPKINLSGKYEILKCAGLNDLGQGSSVLGQSEARSTSQMCVRRRTRRVSNVYLPSCGGEDGKRERRRCRLTTLTIPFKNVYNVLYFRNNSYKSI